MMVQRQNGPQQPESLCYAPVHGGILVRAEGKLTVALYGAFLEETMSLLETSGGSTVYLDLSKCKYMDSTIMGNLVGINRQAKDGIILCKPCPEACQALDIMGLLAFLKIAEEVPEILGDFAPYGKHAEPQAESVLSAHKLLIELNPDNNRRFAGLMGILEEETKRKKSQ